MRYDEDFSALRDSARTPYESLKYIPLAAGGETWMSIGGEARLEYLDFNNEDWRRLGIGRNRFVLQRYNLHTDLHVGRRLRFFAQLRAGLENGRKNGPRGIDEDQLSIQNLFVDGLLFEKGAKKMILRVGRQEIDYGSARLISVDEIPNLRRYFTGAKLMLSDKNWQADAFVMMADTINPGVFDNRPSRQANLWGLYSTFAASKATHIDLYYLGIRRDEAVFDEGTEQERRHSFGTRIWKNNGNLIYNLEGVYQFGRFGEGSISAWTASIDAGYIFRDTWLKPSINLKNDYISGDKEAGDGNLQTFNPLYPRGGYFGFSPQIGPVNLIDLHPYATLDLSSSLKIQLDVVLNWRFSLQDAIYRPSGEFNRSGAAAGSRYIGTGYLAGFSYNLNKHTSLVTGLQYFKTGAFLDEIIPDSQDGLFFNSRLAFKF